MSESDLSFEEMLQLVKSNLRKVSFNIDIQNRYIDHVVAGWRELIDADSADAFGTYLHGIAAQIRAESETPSTLH